MRIDFTVTDDDGNELGFGGTGSCDTLQDLAHELDSIIQNGMFEGSERCGQSSLPSEGASDA